MIQVNFENFNAIFRTNEERRVYFEYLSYLVFSKKYNNGKGLKRFNNQAYIETSTVNNIGFQSKYYGNDGLSSQANINEIKESMEKSKTKYKLKKYIFFCNNDFNQSNHSKASSKTKLLIELEEKAKELNIELEFF